ncbi:MAG: transposase, partial [Candidatus Humimicrobiaceae bacterium]
REDWAAYSKNPFAGPEKVLDYLGRYTRRIAIPNERIKDITRTLLILSTWKKFLHFN